MLFVLAASLAWAQDQTGGIRGTILDAATHQPIRKASVHASSIGRTPSGRPEEHSAVTDQSGAFAFDSLAAGPYIVTAQHLNYPNMRNVRKNVDVKAGEVSDNVTLELTPGASITGHVFDQDGDPLPGCNVHAQPPGNRPRNGQPGENSNSDENGEYRLYNLAAAKYIVFARCVVPPFQPRPFSAGPDPPPTLAYAPQYFEMAADSKSAQVIEAAPGSEKSGVDFRVHITAITQVHGKFSESGANWAGQVQQIQLFPVDPSLPLPDSGGRINPQNRTFDFPRVFPGSYYLIASANIPEGKVGAFERIDVKDRPVDAVVELKHAIDLTGRLELESENNQKFEMQQCNIQLVPEGSAGEHSNHQVEQDGTFLLNAVLPNRYRIIFHGPNVFLKSAWLGSAEVVGGVLDLSSGTAEPLRLVVSTNIATIAGTAPPNQMIFAVTGDEQNSITRGGNSDQSGQFKISGLPPGTYRVFAGDPNDAPQEAQLVTVHEGETANVEVKAPAQ
jgi:Carboxypeptidase regulatory-like domain